MKLTGEFILLNLEQRQGVKDKSKTYSFVALMQGCETFNCIAEEDVFTNLSTVKQFTPVVLDLDFNAQYKSIKVVGIEEIPTSASSDVSVSKTADKPKN